MSVISGKDGAVNGHANVKNWRISYKAETQAYGASGMSGGTSRLAGNKDWSGSFEALGHTPTVVVGDSFTFTGSFDGSKGATGPAIVESITIDCDIEGGGIIGHTVEFSANGDLVLGAAAATDSVVPDPPTAIGAKVALATPSATPSFTDIPDVRKWSLTMRATNPSYVSSDTAGQTKRVQGRFDCDLSIDVYTDDFADATLPEVNDVKHVRLFVSSSIYWDIKWARFGEVSNVECDIESHNPVAGTLNAAMDGHTDIAGTQTVGAVINPSTTAVWP